MRILCLVACSWWILCAPSPAPGEEAAGSLVFEDPVLKKSVQVYYYTPQPPAKLLFLMHGHTRNAKCQEKGWKCQWRFLIAPKAGHGDPSIRPHIEKELLRRP